MALDPHRFSYTLPRVCHLPRALGSLGRKATQPPVLFLALVAAGSSNVVGGGSHRRCPQSQSVVTPFAALAQAQQQQQNLRNVGGRTNSPRASLSVLVMRGGVGSITTFYNFDHAYVAIELLNADICICGHKGSDGAAEADNVAVELLDIDEVWATKKEGKTVYENVRSATDHKNDERKGEFAVEGQGLTLFEDEEVRDQVKYEPASHSITLVGRMKTERREREREGDKGDGRRHQRERSETVWFKLKDKRVPLIAIPTKQAPPDFLQYSECHGVPAADGRGLSQSVTLKFASISAVTVLHLSIKLNEDETYDVGLHIADISYFIKPNTAYDRDTYKRATSVYLGQGVVRVFPLALSEDLCPLVPTESVPQFQPFSLSQRMPAC
ncbi:unnamed protein product [Peniophora sp. CBMAI 1063]|nr:unnamed protein product [Peniophora sp. CBMAI 1063]